MKTFGSGDFGADSMYVKLFTSMVKDFTKPEPKFNAVSTNAIMLEYVAIELQCKNHESVRKKVSVFL